MFGRQVTKLLALSSSVGLAFGLLALGSIGSSWGQTPANSDIEPVIIELFYRSDSDNSNAALEWVKELEQRRPGLKVLSHDVLEDKEQLKRVWELARQFGYQEAQVPTFYLCNNLRVGFGTPETGGRRVEDLLDIKAYVRTGCQHCAAAKRYLDGLVKMRPALRVQYFDVLQSYQARMDMQELARRYNAQVPSMPCIEVAGRLVIGYQTDATSGAKIESYFRHPLPAPSKEKSESEKGSQEENGEGSDGEVSAGGGGTSVSSLMGPRVSRFAMARGLMGFASRTLLTGTLAARTGGVTKEASAHGLQSGNEKKKLEGGISESSASTQSDPIPPASDDLPPLPPDIPLPADAGAAQDLPLPAEGLEPIPPLPESDVSDAMDVPWLGTLSVSQLGMPTFTFLIGLIDGFNPCAMWVLIFLLSVLVNIKDRRKILVVAGTFVVVSGLAYFVFMAAWFNVFQLIGLLRPVQIGLGLLGVVIGLINIKDFFAFHKGVSLSIPESAKPGIYKRVRGIVTANSLLTALSGAIVLAIVVNIVELLCTAGLPAMYTAILEMQKLPTWANYAYLALYIAAYMLDDTILVAIVVSTLSNRRLQESEGRWLKLLSGVVILAIALILLFKPEWLG